MSGSSGSRSDSSINTESETQYKEESRERIKKYKKSRDRHRPPPRKKKKSSSSWRKKRDHPKKLKNIMEVDQRNRPSGTVAAIVILIETAVCRAQSEVSEGRPTRRKSQQQKRQLSMSKKVGDIPRKILQIFYQLDRAAFFY